MDFDSSTISTHATDATGAIAVAGVFGYIGLFCAISGLGYYTLRPLSWGTRLAALFIANHIMWGVTFLMMAIDSLTFENLWEAAFVWKNAPAGPLGRGIFLMVMLVFFSPIPSAYALIGVVARRRSEARIRVTVQ